MYNGRLRYWLYSLTMSKRMCEMIQKDADVLSWSRDPQLETGLHANGEAEENEKRIRRWIAKDTAIAPRDEGGLNMMIWEDHVDAFQVEWVMRYIAPGEAAWKLVLDSFILGQRLWQQSKSKVIPEEYRKYTLIEFGPQRNYYISSKLRKLFQETRDA